MEPWTRHATAWCAAGAPGRCHPGFPAGFRRGGVGVGAHHHLRRGRPPDRVRPRLPRLADLHRPTWWPRCSSTPGWSSATGSSPRRSPSRRSAPWWRPGAGPRRRDLIRLSVGLVAGLIAEISSVGWWSTPAGTRPRHGPLPARVVFLADAVVLHHRAGLADEPGPTPSRRPPDRQVWLVGRTLLLLAGLLWPLPPSSSSSGRSSPPPGPTAGLRTPRATLSPCTPWPSCTAFRWSSCSPSRCYLVDLARGRPPGR